MVCSLILNSIFSLQLSELMWSCVEQFVFKLGRKYSSYFTIKLANGGLFEVPVFWVLPPNLICWCDLGLVWRFFIKSIATSRKIHKGRGLEAQTVPNNWIKKVMRKKCIENGKPVLKGELMEKCTKVIFICVYRLTSIHFRIICQLDFLSFGETSKAHFICHTYNDPILVSSG